MTFKVEVISKETIKPSTPTPDHCTTFPLSFLDQEASPIHVSLLLFYPDHSVTQSDLLKKSLSQSLTHFYPLAGRLNDTMELVNCNDEGVNFFEAQVCGAEIEQVLSDPVAKKLEKLLPRDNFFGLGPKVLLSIQMNMFHCGGMAIGVCISHKVADMASLSLFLASWTAVARGNTPQIVFPEFDMSSLFPPKQYTPSYYYTPPIPVKRRKIVSKRFVFDDTSIAALAAKCSNDLHVKKPTRVESVSALVWKCLMNVVQARRAKSLQTVSTVVTVMVNLRLRGRIVPPLSQSLFGNATTSTQIRAAERDMELHSLVGELREAVRALTKVNCDYVINLCNCPIYWDPMDEYYTISSWCRCHLYETDFGWGEPIWTSGVNVSDKNVIVLLDTKCGNGIEAWVTLDKKDMARFECDPELLTFLVDSLRPHTSIGQRYSPNTLISVRY